MWPASCEKVDDNRWPIFVASRLMTPDGVFVASLLMTLDGVFVVNRSMALDDVCVVWSSTDRHVALAPTNLITL